MKTSCKRQRIAVDLLQISVSGAIIDLSAQKFGMDGLGISAEKVTIRVMVSSKDGKKRMTLFGTFTIGGRHAQISSRELLKLGAEVDVVSIERYSLKNFVEDTNKALLSHPLRGKPEIKWENGKLELVLAGRMLPLTLQSMYVAAAKIFAVMECKRKRLRIALGNDLELFDMSRRKLVGMKLKGEKLMLEREFQHSER
jgi:hypothetical protein